MARKWFRKEFLLGALAIMALAMAPACGLLQNQANMNRLMHDEEYATVVRALSERWDHDDSIPSASVGFDTDSAGGKSTEVRLAIELSYTGRCNSTATDPCDQLANEFTRMVLNNYSKVNELTGIRVVIGKGSHYLYVESSDILFEKSLTIEEWRKELSIEN